MINLKSYTLNVVVGGKLHVQHFKAMNDIKADKSFHFRYFALETLGVATAYELICDESGEILKSKISLDILDYI